MVGIESMDSCYVWSENIKISITKENNIHFQWKLIRRDILSSHLFLSNNKLTFWNILKTNTNTGKRLIILKTLSNDLGKDHQEYLQTHHPSKPSLLITCKHIKIHWRFSFLRLFSSCLSRNVIYRFFTLSIYIITFTFTFNNYLLHQICDIRRLY